MKEREILKRVRALAKDNNHYNKVLRNLLDLKKKDFKKYHEIMIKFENSVTNDLTLLEIL